jgi:hypothetical protein
MSLIKSSERIQAQDVENWIVGTMLARFQTLYEQPLRDAVAPMAEAIVEAFTLQEKDVLLYTKCDTVTHVHKDENRCTSSLSIGTEAKGGGCKVYFDPDNAEDMLDRIDIALVGRAYAANIVAAAQKGGEHNPFGEMKKIGKTFKNIVREHERVADGK